MITSDGHLEVSELTVFTVDEVGTAVEFQVDDIEEGKSMTFYLIPSEIEKLITFLQKQIAP
jgi:hypothetical protein